MRTSDIVFGKIERRASPKPYRNASAQVGYPIRVIIANDEIAMKDSIWTIVVGLSTGILALATFLLALFTWRLAKETNAALVMEKNARADETIRHQDSFMPHLALTVEDQGPISRLLGGGLAKQVTARELYVENIGVGPAISVVVTIIPLEDDDLSYVGQVPVALKADGKKAVLRSSPVISTILLVVEYEDIFGRRFRSTFAGNFTESTPYSWARLFV